MQDWPTITGLIVQLCIAGDNIHSSIVVVVI